MNHYVDAGSIWNDCVTDLYCDDDSIDAERQLDWFSASTSLRTASEGMEGLGIP